MKSQINNNTVLVSAVLAPNEWVQYTVCYIHCVMWYINIIGMPQIKNMIK